MQLFRIALVWCLLLVAPTTTATTSLGFGGGGYLIIMEVGRDLEPVVASLNVSTPRASQGVFLHDNFQTRIFDVKRRVLLIEFQQNESGAEPGSFILSAVGKEATLRIDNRVITAPFSWEM